jgi:hypothetical protein
MGETSGSAKPCGLMRCRTALGWPSFPERANRSLKFLMTETIDLGSLTLKFLQSKDTTDGSVDVFEMTLRPNARMPIPHYHDR